VAGPKPNDILKDYQRKRLLIFLHPERRILGDGYNIPAGAHYHRHRGAVRQGFMTATRARAASSRWRRATSSSRWLAEEFGFLGAMRWWRSADHHLALNLHAAVAGAHTPPA